MTYHPGTVNPAEAQTMTVSLAEDTSIEFALSIARLARVSGTVVDSLGRPRCRVIRTGREPTGKRYVRRWQRSSGGRRYVHRERIAPGEHSLEVRTQMRLGATEPGEFGSASMVMAGADISGVRIVTGKDATISGRVIFEGTRPRGNGAQGALRVLPTPADPSKPFMVGTFFNDPRWNGSLDENGNFQLAGLSGRVFLQFSAAGWMITSISVDGEDVTDEPLDLTGTQSIAVVMRVTDKLTQISGQVSDSRGQRTRECTIVFQSAEAREPIVASRWLRTLRCDSSGSFQTQGMRPGSYVVTVIESLEQGRQFEPEFQQQLRRAGQSFSIREGATLTLDLKLSEL